MKNPLRFIPLAVLFALCAPLLASAAQVSVSLNAGAISPATITINPGDTVVWSNTSGSNQSVTANNGTFQSGTIAPTGSFAATFNTPGTYQYYDNANGSAIIGSVIVAQSAAQNTNPNYNYYANTGTQTTTNTSSLSAQTQALIAQIAQLEAQLQSGGTGAGAATTGASGCPALTRSLKLGMSGADVSALQTFLARNSSIYPEGQVTGYFGALTQAAVQRFQTQYSIVSSGSPSTTGYGLVGPRTIAAIGSVCAGGGASTTGNPNAQQTVSGYMQVSPISGAAPLTVNASVTVNTANSCAGATYALNWGDGSAAQTITVAQGNCSQQNQVIQHTYTSGGTYQVILSAGGHSSTATVTVSGGSSSTTQNSTQPVGSITAFTTSGPAPLSTTFYVSCVSGLAYDVIFGDGQELGGSGVSQSACNGGLQSIPHTYANAGSYTAQLVAFVRDPSGAITTQVLGTTQISVGNNPQNSGTTIVGYAQPTVNKSVGGNPLAISLAFKGDTCSGAYTIDWGDGGLSVSPTVDSSSCSQTQTSSYTVSHTYLAAGNYSVILKRGIPGGSAQQTDSSQVTISQ